MKCFRLLTQLLVVIGALNWGLVGFFNYNPINDLLGFSSARVIYGVVGIAGLLALVCMCQSCTSTGGCGPCRCGKTGCNCGPCGCGKPGCNCGSKGPRYPN